VMLSDTSQIFVARPRVRRVGIYEIARLNGWFRGSTVGHNGKRAAKENPTIIFSGFEFWHSNSRRARGQASPFRLPFQVKNVRGKISLVCC